MTELPSNVSSPTSPLVDLLHHRHSIASETTATSASNRRTNSGLLPTQDEDHVKKSTSLPKRIQTSLSTLFNRVPRRYKFLFILLWLLWKFLTAAVFVYVVGQQHPALKRRRGPPLRVLYIITSLADYNTGKRKTTKGQDRLTEVLLPILVDSVSTMVATPLYYQVDVYLILAYELRPERKRLIQQRLPPHVGLEIWDQANPIGYDTRFATTRLVNNTRALARQHRYVIKDKLEYYDLFCAFEDDMRITGHHVHNFVQLSNELEAMQQSAPTVLPPPASNNNNNSQEDQFDGPLTKQQALRLIPGFIRVEVVLNSTLDANIQATDAIPSDHRWSPRHHIRLDPQYCCHVNMEPNIETPVNPPKEQVLIWETNIKALSVRRLPTRSSTLEWVALLPGPGKRMPPELVIGRYWSGRDGDFGDEPKPSPGMPDLIAQQGGWMATRQQILHLNEHCMGTLLPPFDPPTYHSDGQESNNVEFWSGGYQLFTGVKGGCNMQRIVSLHPDHISKHFIYHVANNKQRQLSRNRLVRADDLVGQLNTVKRRAEKALHGTD